MCIRDRVITFHDGVDNLRIFGIMEDSVILIEFLEGSDPKPVSYTHLRAHETVLDLVCRLLLEKKKTNSTIAH